AMACRKPVISTNLPTGVPWVNQSGTTGLVVSPSNVAELAGAIQRLLANPGLREDMGEAGRRRVEENFTSEKMAAGLLEVYQSVLNHARSERIIRKPVQELRPTVPDIESLRVRRIASKETRT
ncbi:MAG: glycosyltransferase, partial [Candidatus Acidiferrales bacterium]